MYVRFFLVQVEFPTLQRCSSNKIGFRGQRVLSGSVRIYAVAAVSWANTSTFLITWDPYRGDVHIERQLARYILTKKIYICIFISTKKLKPTHKALVSVIHINPYLNPESLTLFMYLHLIFQVIREITKISAYYSHIDSLSTPSGERPARILTIPAREDHSGHPIRKAITVDRSVELNVHPVTESINFIVMLRCIPENFLP